MVEVLTQDQCVPLPVEKQVAIIYAGVNGFIDNVPVDVVRRFESELFGFIERRNPEPFKTLREKKTVNTFLLYAFLERSDIKRQINGFLTRHPAQD